MSRDVIAIAFHSFLLRLQLKNHNLIKMQQRSSVTNIPNYYFVIPNSYPSEMKITLIVNINCYLLNRILIERENIVCLLWAYEAIDSPVCEYQSGNLSCGKWLLISVLSEGRNALISHVYTLSVNRGMSRSQVFLEIIEHFGKTSQFFFIAFLIIIP